MFYSINQESEGDILNAIQKQAKAIADLKEIFGEMCSSRRRLKPILTEIVKALDDNLFVDADSVEVKYLLDLIVKIQSQFARVDELKGATNSKRVDKLENAINNLDVQNSINEMKLILLRFEDLTCRSSNVNELDAAKKLQRQAHKLLLRADKIKPDEFIDEGQKFKDVIEKIDDPSTMSMESLMELQQKFPENPGFVFLLMNSSLVIPKNKFSSGKSDQSSPSASTDDRIKVINKLIRQFGASVEPLIADDSSFDVETAETKKQLSFKSFNNKLHSYIDGSDTGFYPLLKHFCTSRVLLLEHIERLQGSSYSSIAPMLSGKLFQWGVLNKIHWFGHSFYYLNDHGYELLTKILMSKDSKSPQKKSQRAGMTYYVRRFMLLSAFGPLDIDRRLNKSEGDAQRFWIKTKFVEGEKLKVYFSFALLLLDNDWADHVCNFISEIELELRNKADIKALFLSTVLDAPSVLPWLKMFKKLGVKNVFAMYFGQATIEYYDADGDRINFEDMVEYTRSAEFDAFADYKNKYIKKTRRGRKKAASEETVDVTPPVEKKKRSGRSKKNEPIDPSKMYVFDKEAATASLFDRESTASLFDHTDDDTTSAVEETSTVDDDTTAAVEETSTVDDDTTSAIVETSTVDENTVVVENTLAVENISIDQVEIIDEKFLRSLVQNAVVLFMRGSTARGLLELQALAMHNELSSIVDFDLSARNVEWFRGLSALTAFALDDPIMSAHVANFGSTGNLHDLFYRDTPFDDINADYLFDFFATTLVIKESYAPDMSNIYDIRTRQTQMLADKSNAAFKLCPSIKRLVTLFKTFTSQTGSPFSESLHVDHEKLKVDYQAAMSLIEQARGRADATLRASIKHPRIRGLSRRLYDTDGIIRRLIDLDGVSIDEIINFCSRFFDDETPPFDARRKITEDMFDENKIGEFLDTTWDNVKVDLHKKEKFTGVERAKQINALCLVLTALLSYAASKIQLGSIGNESPAPVADALSFIDGIIDEGMSHPFTASINDLGPALLITCIKRMRESIEERKPVPFYRECLLGSKYIELDDKGLPELDNIGAARYSFACRVFDYERALGSQTLEEAVQSACETAVRSFDLGVFNRLEQNYREQLDLSDEKIKQIKTAAGTQVKRRLEILHRGFLDRLELDRHYARLINPGDVDYYMTAVETARHHFDETNNAGLFERFIDAIKGGIVDGSMNYVEELRNRLSTVEDQSVRSSVEQLIDVGRLNVAEDIINEGSTVELHADGGLDDFLNSYEPIFNVCVKNKNEPLEKILSSLKRNLNDERLREFAEAWQNISSKTNAIPSLLRHLSYEVIEAGSVRRHPNNQLEFHAQIKHEPYPIPIAPFNLSVARDGLDFVYMPYNLTLDQLLETLKSIERRRCGMICLLNMALSLADRRKLAHLLKLRAELSNIIVIDRVLAVYLTSFDRSERREKLLRAALPFANVNPYVEGDTDMFIDRERELEALRNINGARFLVGGRQLGKTALLDHLLKLDHKPSEGVHVIKPETNDWDSVRSSMVELLSRDDVKRVILLLDVNKTFASIKGTELEIFEDVRRQYAGRFKYIVTAHHRSALSLDESIMLKPFTPSEAALFTLEPLNYVGLKVHDAGIIRSIWVQANYCPGILKYYCGKTVEAIVAGYERKTFDATKNPPYELDDEFLKNMLRQRDLHEELKRRLLSTLFDANEDYCYVLMLAVAYALHDSKERTVDLTQIKDICLLSDLEDLSEMNDEMMELLLEEMIDLKLLRQSGDRYEFYRLAFRYAFGDESKQLEERLAECKRRRTSGVSK